jgi:hypothetical protein
MKESEMIHTWKGKEIDTLSREELIEIIKFLIHEMEVLREDRDAWRRGGSAVQYMLQKNKGEMK